MHTAGLLQMKFGLIAKANRKCWNNEYEYEWKHFRSRPVKQSQTPVLKFKVFIKYRSCLVFIFTRAKRLFTFCKSWRQTNPILKPMLKWVFQCFHLHENKQVNWSVIIIWKPFKFSLDGSLNEIGYFHCNVFIKSSAAKLLFVDFENLIALYDVEAF